MEHLSKTMLIESDIQRHQRDAQLARHDEGYEPPSRPMAWRAYLVVAVVIVGFIVWWII